MLDPIGVFLLQLEPVLPRRTVHVPVLVVNLINAQQNALLILAHIGEALQIHRHRHFEIKVFKLRYRVGNQVMVVQRRHRQLDPDREATAVEFVGVDVATVAETDVLAGHQEDRLGAELARGQAALDRDAVGVGCVAVIEVGGSDGGLHLF